MKTNGPYYSDVLRNAILSHSMRWCKHEPDVAVLLQSLENSEYFFEEATRGVHASISQGKCPIPIIQSLLLLSAQHTGRGNVTQSWLYSGIAFRLLEDSGITIDCQKYARSCGLQFSDEDYEIRNRLFWSCYFWDKMLALYLGRAPIIQDTPVSPPKILRK